MYHTWAGDKAYRASTNKAPFSDAKISTQSRMHGAIDIRYPSFLFRYCDTFMRPSLASSRFVCTSVGRSMMRHAAARLRPPQASERRSLVQKHPVTYSLTLSSRPAYGGRTPHPAPTFCHGDSRSVGLSVLTGLPSRGREGGRDW